jgi:hypothetical protein
VTKEEIRSALSKHCSQLDDSLHASRDSRDFVRLVGLALEERSRLQRHEVVVREAEARCREFEIEARAWQEKFASLSLRPQSAAPTATSQPMPAAGPTSVKSMLKGLSATWQHFVVFHAYARKTAEAIVPKLSLRDLRQLGELLNELGTYQRDRSFAIAEGARGRSLAETFGNRYAPTETDDTKVRYRTDAPYNYEGASYKALEHLKMTTSRGHKVRVYFDRLPGERLLVCEIGHRKTYGHDG